MDEDLSIINASNRNEKIRNFFINNKGKIISLIIFLIIIVAGLYTYDNYIENKKKEISDNFNSITIDFKDSKKENTAQRLIEIINEKDPTYSTLSLYFIIDNNLVVDPEKVNRLFDLIINEISLDNEIKNLIVYKKALYNADNIEESELLNIIKPLINSESVWKSHALYLVGEYFYSKDQKQKAKEFFDQIISLKNPNPEILKNSQRRLNRDLSD